jgi:hypothetical protein
MYILNPSAMLPDKITMVIELATATRYNKCGCFRFAVSNANFHFEYMDTFPQNHHKHK